MHWVSLSLLPLLTSLLPWTLDVPRALESTYRRHDFSRKDATPIEPSVYGETVEHGLRIGG